MNKRRVQTAARSRKEPNPFSIPPDEKIFTFKEEEKARKVEERKRNSKLKIWEKNKPSREGKLRAICDTDIQMADIIINEEFHKQQKFQDSGIESIPVDTQKNKENKHDLLQRNKNIFLVAQMLAIKQDEIQKLEDFQDLRDEGLKFSESHLNQDIKQFIEFFKENREKSNTAVKQAEKQSKIKQEKLNLKKEINAKYQEYVSEITKNIEKLKIYSGYRDFLMEIHSRRQLDLRGDNETDDVPSKQTSKPFNFYPKAKQKLGEMPDIPIEPNLKELIENEDTFKDKLEANLLDEDFFTALEEKNLFLIQQLQNLESKEKQSVDVRRNFLREVDELEARQEEIEIHLEKAQSDYNLLFVDEEIPGLHDGPLDVKKFIQEDSSPTSHPAEHGMSSSKFTLDDLTSKVAEIYKRIGLK